MISEVFFENKKSNYLEQIVFICNTFFDWHQTVPAKEEIDNYVEYVDAYAALESYLLKQGFEPVQLELTSSLEENIKKIVSFFVETKTEYEQKYNEELVQTTITTARNKYRQELDLGFLYRFSDGDIKRIQELLNELRDLITESQDFDASHKDRLLKRLENLQKELHKKMSSLDKFWGLVGDAGVVLGKFGKDAKPFVDRIKEITQIIWNIQARAEELPSNISMPVLGDNKPSN
jgi:hypothetical protein